MYPIRNEEILEVAVEASLAASDIIMGAVHNPLIKKVKKSDSDLVTQTDLESEKIIKNFIIKNFPGHSILAEESDQKDNNSDYLLQKCYLTDMTEEYLKLFLIVGISISFH